MFTLAQYVLGIGKSDTLNDENCASNDTAYYENDDPTQCVQTNIENDWILIEIEQKNSNTLVKDEARAAVGARKPRVKSRGKQLQSQEESWFVDPPECFKNASPDSRDVKTSSLENLLIEHPSMSVFDHLFTKRVVNTNLEQLKKPSPKAPSTKKSDNCNENALAVRSNKKKQSEIASVKVLVVSNQNKALTAAIKSADAFNKKKCITKKNYERKNKVVRQRNGPTIRQKKMFTHLNGVYHNRNNC